MEQEITNLMLALIRSAMGGEVLSDAERSLCTKERITAVLKLASSHDIAHLVAWGIKKTALAPELAAASESYIFKAVYRYQQIKFEYEKLIGMLENAKIPFIPLKGSVIRSYYPEPWMRTSCDIDILIHRSDLERVQSILIDTHKYRLSDSCPHDVAFLSPTGVNVEIHFDLIEEGLVNSSAKALKNVWSASTVKEGFEYHREMADSFFYFYHIAHMAKHVLNGGCGVKPFIDLWLLDSLDTEDEKGREELLSRGGLLRFAEVARRLYQAWFCLGGHDLLTLEMQDYVLRGGVYGSLENHVAIQRRKKGSRFKYALSLIILPYDSIKYIYPVLQKHRWLTPVMQMHRWISLILRGRLRKAKKTIESSNNVSDESVERAYRFLDGVGLS